MIKEFCNTHGQCNDGSCNSQSLPNNSTRQKIGGASNAKQQNRANASSIKTPLKKQEPPTTSTPQKPRKAPQKPIDISLSPIIEPIETNAIDKILDKSQQKESPGKSKKRSLKKENKENSGLQNQKSPNTSISSTNLSPLEDTTNIAMSLWMQ